MSEINAPVRSIKQSVSLHHLGNIFSKGLRMCTSKRLAAIKGISDAKVEKMKEAARKLDGHEFVTGFEYAEQRKESSDRVLDNLPS